MYFFYDKTVKRLKINLFLLLNIKVYQMLATMVDEIATVIDNSAGKNEKDEKLANTINRSKTISIPLNSDFI
jgi:hypothetical protein